MKHLRSTPLPVAILVIATLFLGVHAQSAHALFEFVQVSGPVGIEPYAMPKGLGAGVSAADFDADGDIDIFVPNAIDIPDQLYINRGNGKFAESAALRGLASLGNNRAALWFDYDGDNRLDLVVAGDCWAITDRPCEGTLTLYKQTPQHKFIDVTSSAGDFSFDAAFGHLGGISAGDINNDGYLDLYISAWRAASKVFLNNGDGTFTDISESSGAAITGDDAWQAGFYDFNADGWIDIFVAVDFSQNRLFINQGDNTFVDIAVEANVVKGTNEMGVAISDYDNDLDFDMFVTNIRAKVALYKNVSVGSTPEFLDVAPEVGIEETGWSWGCTFLDANNDGLTDIAVTNGYLASLSRVDPSAFLLNIGGNPTSFLLAADEVGFNDTRWGSAVLALDYDRDGRLDLLQNTKNQDGLERPALVRILRNTLDPEVPLNHFMVVKPRQDGPNHWAIGAVVRVQTGETVMSRLITAGTSYIGQEPAEAHFGLGAAVEADSITIEWPNGDESVFENVLADRIYEVERESIIYLPYDLDADGLADDVEIRIYGTDPSLLDTDDDGVPDGHEVSFGSDPLDPESTAGVPASARWSLILTALIIVALGTQLLGRWILRRTEA